jgi:hypothetical protein
VRRFSHVTRAADLVWCVRSEHAPQELLCQDDGFLTDFELDVHDSSLFGPLLPAKTRGLDPHLIEPGAHRSHRRADIRGWNWNLDRASPQFAKQERRPSLCREIRPSQGPQRRRTAASRSLNRQANDCSMKCALRDSWAKWL